jgi:hypothetical protein
MKFAFRIVREYTGLHQHPDGSLLVKVLFIYSFSFPRSPGEVYLSI